MIFCDSRCLQFHNPLYLDVVSLSTIRREATTVIHFMGHSSGIFIVHGVV